METIKIKNLIVSCKDEAYRYRAVDGDEGVVHETWLQHGYDQRGNSVDIKYIGWSRKGVNYNEPSCHVAWSRTFYKVNSGERVGA